MRKLLFALALALPTAACAEAQPGSASYELPGPVSYEVNSWGQLLVRWQVNPDGSGEIWRGELGKREISKFRFRLSGDALKTFIKNVEDAREATREGFPCKHEVTDQPYGSIIWDYPGARRAYSFDAGCRSEKGDEVQDILTAASSNVETLAKIEPKPYIVEPVPQR